MARKNRFDMLDNTVHKSTALDYAQIDYQLKKKEFEKDIDNFGKVMDPLDISVENISKFKNQSVLGSDGAYTLELGLDAAGKAGAGIAPEEAPVDYKFTPREDTDLFNDFIPRETQNSWGKNWDGKMVEQNFKTAREQGSNPVPPPADTTIDIDAEGTMNELFS